ncbi:MAG: hypothetical protein IRD7MM_01950 [Candidatus Midichloria mitochondrii]|uniref:hydroxyethylthiazole kinase n=1 Tax=Candidatus Midichloria mitochondrii TaxID=234827 RepID=UPI0002D2F2D9|nr:hydroxyethylthiazole kinase [Candidatus Midichloria mitochondrii]
MLGDLLQYADIVRGNASEIIALHNTQNKTFGVETLNTIEETKDKAQALAKEHNITVVVSGEKDFITDADKEKNSTPFGSPLMPLVTGMRCVFNSCYSYF